MVPAAPTVAAVALIVAVTAVNLAGVRWTARVTWVLVAVVLTVLAAVVVAGSRARLRLPPRWPGRRVGC